MDDQEPLVRAMPRRPLYGLSGFVGKIDIAILTAVAEEGWCATRTAIAADVDSKEVRIGVVVTRRAGGATEVMAGPGAEVLRLCDIPPEVGGLGDFRALALAAAQAMCPAARAVEMAGYFNDDVAADWRRVFVIVYRAIVPPEATLPDGAAWRSRSDLLGMGLPEAVAKVVTGLP